MTSENIMNQVSNTGACFLEDMKKIDEQTNSRGSVESMDTSCVIHKNDGIVGINGLVEGGKSIITYQRKKRQKTTELLSDRPKSYLEIIEESSLKEDLDKGLNFSDNEQKVPIVKSNGNTSDSCHADVAGLELREHRTDQTDNDELPRVASGDDMAINTSSCDADMLAVNLVKENANEVKENVGNVEEENIGNFPNGLKVVDESVNVATYAGKKLLVLDVNGLLVDINSYVPYDYDPDDIILKKAVFKRPYCDDFLRFCFERFNVGVWSSRTKRNIEPILDFLLGKDKCKLLFCWDQSHCTNTGYYTVEKRYKPLLLKKLKKLWEKFDPDLPWERGLYNATNTLLLDDTPYKALSNPRYTAIFPYSYRFRNLGDNSLAGPGGDIRTYLEGLATAENVQEYVEQNPFGQRAITERNLSWRYYLKVIEASSTPPRQTDDEDNSLQ
ncbi:hypothetical protein ACP275_04G146500 [Erythranthe tilingii]